MPDVTVDAPNGAEAVVSEVPATFEDYLKVRSGDTKPESKEAAATEPEAKTEGESDTSTTEQDKSSERDENGRFKPKKSEAEKRIDKLTAKYREAERERDELRRQLEDRDKKPAEVKAEAKSSDDDPEPKTDDFETYEKFVKAQARWEARQEIKAERERTATEAKKQSEAATQKTAMQKWQESQSAVREKHADYDDVIQEAAEDIKAGKYKPVPQSVFDAIVESDSKAELFYHLAKNREDLGRLTSATSEKLMLLELGKIEAKLTQPVPETKIKVPSIPKPPSVVGGTAKGGSSADAADFNTYYSRRMAEKHRR